MPVTPLAMGLGRTRLLFVRDAVNIVVRYPLIFVGLFTGGLLGLCWRAASAARSRS